MSRSHDSVIDLYLIMVVLSVMGMKIRGVKIAPWPYAAKAKAATDRGWPMTVNYS